MPNFSPHIGSWRDEKGYKDKQEEYAAERARDIIPSSPLEESLNNLGYNTIRSNFTPQDRVNTLVSRLADDLFGNSDLAKLLKIIRVLLPVHRIYYPAAGTDPNLELAFRKDEIFYLDLDHDSSFSQGRNFVKGDYKNPPFAAGSFDALYYNDNHAPMETFLDMLNLVRDEGVVIYNSDHCINEVTPQEILAIPKLKRIGAQGDHWVLQKNK